MFFTLPVHTDRLLAFSYGYGRIAASDPQLADETGDQPPSGQPDKRTRQDSRRAAPNPHQMRCRRIISTARSPVAPSTDIIPDDLEDKRQFWVRSLTNLGLPSRPDFVLDFFGNTIGAERECAEYLQERRRIVIHRQVLQSRPMIHAPARQFNEQPDRRQATHRVSAQSAAKE